MEKKDIRLKSDSGSIRESSSMILKDLESCEIGEKTAFDIKLCVEEAVRNAIVHGNKSDPKRQVRMKYWLDDDALNIEIEDEGAGFDHSAVDDPTKKENLLRNSGRGVFLIKKLMDNVEYNAKGNKIIIVKKIRR